MESACRENRRCVDVGSISILQRISRLKVSVSLILSQSKKKDHLPHTRGHRLSLINSPAEVQRGKGGIARRKGQKEKENGDEEEKEEDATVVTPGSE